MLRKLSLSVAVVAAAVAAVAAASRAYTGAPLRISTAPPRALRVESTGSLPELAAALPGASADGALVLANRGSLAARVALELTATGSPALRHALRVSFTGGRLHLADRPLRGVQQLDLGVLAPGRIRRLRVRVDLPADAGDAVEGLTVVLAGRIVALSDSSRTSAS